MFNKIHCVMLITLLPVIFSQPQRSPQPATNSRKLFPTFRETVSSVSRMTLPDNATAIRENIVDTFSCDNRIYGYYADIDNECQIFHVCLPMGRGARRFSFICPNETVFNQETFVCTRTRESIPCEQSEDYYERNEQFGKEEPNENEKEDDDTPLVTYSPDVTGELPSVTPFSFIFKRRGGKSFDYSNSTIKVNNNTEESLTTLSPKKIIT